MSLAQVVRACFAALLEMTGPRPTQRNQQRSSVAAIALKCGRNLKRWAQRRTANFPASVPHRFKGDRATALTRQKCPGCTLVEGDAFQLVFSLFFVCLRRRRVRWLGERITECRRWKLIGKKQLNLHCALCPGCFRQSSQLCS